MSGLPLVNFGGTNLPFLRGPQNFICYPKARVNDNLSTSGFRERVTQAIDLMISFEMQAIRINDDYQAWAQFQNFALAGGQFALAPSNGSGFFDCVSDDMTFQTTRKGVGVYSAKCLWRIVPDDLQPTDHGVVMGMFYQVNSPLVITTASLPGGTNGSGYFQSLAFTGGTGPVWSLVSTALPPGLMLSTAGLVSGTPTAAGTYRFTVQVLANGFTAYATFGVVIA